MTIESNPPGKPVIGQDNTFDYPILKNVTLNCAVSPNVRASSYQWNTRGCYKNSGGNPRCFAHGQTIRTITGYSLSAKDAGTITCTATINKVKYTSNPLTIRVSGNVMHILYGNR